MGSGVVTEAEIRVFIPRLLGLRCSLLMRIVYARVRKKRIYNDTLLSYQITLKTCILSSLERFLVENDVFC